MKATGFRCRAALLWTVEQAVTRYHAKGGGDVSIYGVMGGYEGRSVEKGAPKGAHKLLKTVVAPARNVPLAGQAAPAVLPAAPPRVPPAERIGRPVSRKVRQPVSDAPAIISDPGDPTDG